MKTPIYLINGKLGSGKTTILLQILNFEKFKNSAIIENEIASQDFDSGMIKDSLSNLEIKKISGECVCCSDPMNLIKITKELRKAEPSRPIIIESTGAASAIQLVTKLVTASDFNENFEIAQIIYVADILRINRGEIDEVDMLLSDIVVVTKNDLLKDSLDIKKVISDLGVDNVIFKKTKDDTTFIKLINSTSNYKSNTLKTINLARDFSLHEPMAKTVRFSSDTYFDTTELFNKQVELNIERVKGIIKINNKEQIKYNATRDHFVLHDNQLLTDSFLVVIDNNYKNVKEYTKWLKSR
jgi:G3E family GTPase